MSSTAVPPLTTEGVFSVSTSILIDAPIETVWSILLDFESYNEWNPFRHVIIDPITKKPLPSQTLQEGQLVLAEPVHIPPTMGEVGIMQKGSAYVKCFVLDTVNYRMAWTSGGSVPGFLLHPERWDFLTVTSEGKTKYESVEVVKGILAYPLRFLMSANLKLGFDAMADALKVRAEELV
ncbi:hypothetical protein BDZ94DRAFT_1232347 [Collybia nuda]|uniref:Coenzyme Q-binding protein COQ10 START domain-containing protein n=1 Tax=Collybia nuda TaxID=64659 RepID=A0A9P5YGL2_9AGAR|nr:hypothetical protein BDZ94DRAFT_1232347 [Collybia nuda]